MGHVPHWRVHHGRASPRAYLMGVYRIGIHFMDICLIAVQLKGVYLISVHLVRVLLIDVYVMSVRPTGVCLMGIRLSDMHLIAVYILMGVYLMGPAFRCRKLANSPR